MRRTVTLLLLLSLESSSVANECLAGLQAKSESPSEVRVSWSYSCSQDKLEKVKVYFFHDGFLACSNRRKDGTRPSGFGSVQVFASNFSEEVKLAGLHPASRYVIDTTDIRLDTSRKSKAYVEVETKEGRPQVKATRRTTLQGSHPPTDMSLYWDWGPPPPSQCSEAQAVPHHYRWHLRSLDRDEPGREGILPLSQTSLHLAALTPDSRYELTVNVANRAGEWDERRGLRLPQSTLVSKIEDTSGGIGLVTGLLAAAIVFAGIFLLILFLFCRRRLHQRKQQKKVLNETAAKPLMGEMGGIASSPEHEYEKLNYELMPRLNSLGRACKLASTESLDDDGYLKNNDQRVVDDAEADDDGYVQKSNDRHLADQEDVDEEGYLRNNEQRGQNQEGNAGNLNMTDSSKDTGLYIDMSESSKSNSGKSGFQRPPTSL